MTNFSSTVALVTGANKGIGYEIARGLAAKGIMVLMGCRNEQRGNAAAAALIAEGLTARAVHLDVTSHDSLRAAAAYIGQEFGKLDILVNNAGVSLENRAKASVVDLEIVREVFETNVFGVIAATQAMLPLLYQSPGGRIVNLSSSLGSLGLASDPNSARSKFVLLAYNTSKTAVNGVTVQFANELNGSNIKVNAACPGHCATDLNHHTGRRSAAEGSVAPIRLATLPPDGPSGGFFDEQGCVPW